MNRVAGSGVTNHHCWELTDVSTKGKLLFMTLSTPYLAALIISTNL